MPKVAPVSRLSCPHPSALSEPPRHPRLDWASRGVKSRSARHQWKNCETPAQRGKQRGGERRETNGSHGEEEREGGMDFKNNNSKKTNNREKKNKWEKRGKLRRSSEAPKVLELIKMICIYLWGLMSSFSIVCFPLIWIFPFHYVT